MAGEASAQREKQDQSIKARKNELFVGEQVEETGPRKKLRDYLKETPAAPLSKNVKLSLWGSAVPVVLLFVVAMVSPNRTTAKAPTEVLWTAPKLAAPLAIRSDDKPPAPASEAKAGDNKDKAAASADKPAEDKPKPKAKKDKSKKGKSKPKDTVVVQNTEGDKANGDKDKGNDNPSGESKKKPNTASSDSGNKGKMGGSKDAKSKSATSAPPRKQAPSILVKKKKPYNPAYPSKTPVGDKKADPDADAGIP